MRKSLFFLVIIICSFTSKITYSQLVNQTSFSSINDNYPVIEKPISALDSIRLINIPAIEVPALYRSANAPILPSSLDNSLQPYFRPVTSQSGYECGQTAGIAFVFTYEVNRLRNLASNVAANQYPTHFSWNFLNDAYNYTGVSFFDTWEITRTVGTPNVVDYGGALNTGGEKRWMNGYPAYYNGMKNRISGVYSIRCDTPEGLSVLRNWYNDHLDGSTIGGIACIYAQYCSPNATLPVGTPEAGKALISSWGSSPSHAWTIAGYNDSIRFDYNNDGLYTNNIDINGDGVVDMKDWEIGGLKIVNGYAGTGWGNSGFSYMMYKSLAESIGNGGIWNHSVFVVKAKQTQTPQLTMKVSMKHNKRNQIKVIVGVNQDQNATRPATRIEFPIFNFHGDAIGMQGDTTEAAKTIEFGLDVTPLLSGINTAQTAKFFLEIVEKDPSALGSGFVNSLSLMDYTGTFVETLCSTTNVAIVNNDTTRLSVSKIMAFNKVAITNDSMIAKVYQPYSHQLSASQGSQPYKWDLKMDYSETITNASFPNLSNQTLSVGSAGYVVQNLNFSFPFFGKSYSQIYIYPNGYIKFDNSLFTFPFLIDANLLFRSHKMIAGFLASLSFGSGQGIWFQGDANAATIQWKASVNAQTGSNVNVALKIFPSGKIEIYYGSIIVSGSWLSALSGGDVINYQYASLSNSFLSNTIEKKAVLQPPDYPDLMNLTEAGLFSATPNRYHNTNIKFRVTDNNNISVVSSVPFKTKGLSVEYTVNAGGDSIVNSNDTVYLSAKIKNIGLTTVSNANILLQSQDTMINIIDGFENIGTMAGGDSLIIPNIFKFKVAFIVPDGHYIDLLSKINSPLDTFERHTLLRVNSFLITTGNVSFTDGNNNILEPNETAAMMLEIKNIGGASVSNLQLALSTNDPYITLNPGFANIDSIQPFSSKNAFFIITTAPNTPAHHLVVLNAHITGNANFSFNTFFYIEIGGGMEDFETNDFTKYNWNHGGNLHWFTSDSLKYQGNYSAKSGNITHYQTSFISVTQYVLADSYIRFYKKVSCERDNTNHNYDYLAFYIDGIEKARWDGEIDWSQEIFNVTTGNHTFKWAYVKDGSVNSFADCGWVDNIIFPIHGDPNPNLIFSPMIINKTLGLNSMDTVMLNITNSGLDLVIYTTNFRFLNVVPSPWVSCATAAGGVGKNESQNLTLDFNSQGLLPGNYNCELKMMSNFVSQTIIPVYLHVLNNISVSELQQAMNNISCFPNPVSNACSIHYTLNQKAKLEIAIYDYTGKLIKKLLPQIVLSKGDYSINWDLTDNNNAIVEAGFYLCKLSAGNEIFTQKLIVVK
ncbi:MAG: T9SS type A sorting domain-containing protein [Bacteroidales bacterium]